MAWTNITKNTSSFSNQSKNTATWTKIKKYWKEAKFGTAIFGQSKFGVTTTDTMQVWTNQTKH
ncbi:MAG: hypothetical protein ACTSQA_06850 [Candidatus Heimdallarchaeaceae archaeon]